MNKNTVPTIEKLITRFTEEGDRKFVLDVSLKVDYDEENLDEVVGAAISLTPYIEVTRVLAMKIDRNKANIGGEIPAD